MTRTALAAAKGKGERMDKRISQRKTGKFLAAAVAGLGLAGFGAAQSDAALVIDMRALTAPGATISDGGKTVTADPGALTGPITFAVFARVTGSNGVQQVDDFGSGDVIDTRNDDAVQIVSGGFTSTGGLLGDFQTGNQRFAPFTGSGSSDGMLQDLDSDGDLDIGVAGTVAEGGFSARAGNPTHAVLLGGSSPQPLQSSIIDTNTSEMRIGTIRWNPDAGATGNMTVNFFARPVSDGGGATWFEDLSTLSSAESTKTPGTGAFSVNPGVNVSIIPEPASLGLLGLAGLGLLARRRNNA